MNVTLFNKIRSAENLNCWPIMNVTLIDKSRSVET